MADVIPIPVETQVVDMEAGEVVSTHAASAMMLPAPADTCPECAVEHGADEPHNAQSLFYQMKFHAERNRWPNWTDAMAHCAEPVKLAWTEALCKAGVDVLGGEINPKGAR